MPRLEKWSIGTAWINPYQAPECQKIHLNGTVYDDQKGRFSDGTLISTSSIQELNIKENYAMTRNTKYILGEPDDEYVKWLESQGKTLEGYVK